MDEIAVVVDDAGHAARLLTPLLEQASGAAPWHWLVVACPPPLPHRIARHLAPAQRRQWREAWALELQRQLAPLFSAMQPGPTSAVQWVLADGPLPTLAARLRQRRGSSLRLLDARAPRLGVAATPLCAAPGTAARGGRWAGPIAISTSLSLVLALAD